MQNYHFERAARTRRATALFLAVSFHLVLAGALLYGGEAELDEYLPEVVKEWFDTEKKAEDIADTARP